MTKPISAAAHAEIEAAMARLLATADDRATVTIARLASEAGLSRATLYRAPELLGRFQAALKRCNADRATGLAVPDRNMAQHIQALSLLVREQEQQIAKLQLELSESARVVSLAGPVRR